MSEGIIPIRVAVPSWAWIPLAKRAKALGYSSPTAFVEHEVLAAVLGDAKGTQRVLYLNTQGWTNKEIAADTGITIGSIQERLARYGLHSNRERKVS